MNLIYDEGYTDTFHSPGIEPWIMGFLKGKGSLGKVLDIGCGLGFTAFLLKLYLDNVEYLVGVDVSAEKIQKARRLNLYDELYVVDIRDFKPNSKFDAVIALEVLHVLPAEALMSVEGSVKEGGTVVLALPQLPQGVSIEFLINRGYNVYRYLIRGLVLINLKNYDVLLAWDSLFLRILKFALITLKPLFKAVKAFRKGYLLAFK
ncbi:MAG: class I SAM-dependent methyltransferase [Candidatus Bathyarchaeia archaeon]